MVTRALCRSYYFFLYGVEFYNFTTYVSCKGTLKKEITEVKQISITLIKKAVIAILKTKIRYLKCVLFTNSLTQYKITEIKHPKIRPH